MQRLYRVIVSPEAIRNLDAILVWMKRDSVQNALTVFDSLWQATQSLQRFPHRYKIYRQNRKSQLVIRSMPVPPFVIYYRVIERFTTVRVLTVRHGARRQPRRFRR